MQEILCRLAPACDGDQIAEDGAGVGLVEARELRFRPWFRRGLGVRSLLRDRWRKGEDKPFAEPVEAAHTTDPSLSIDVSRALQHLKPRERELLWLAYVEGMSHAEIADATGFARLSVRMLLYRARNNAALLLNPGRTR